MPTAKRASLSDGQHNRRSRNSTEPDDVCQMHGASLMPNCMPEISFTGCLGTVYGTLGTADRGERTERLGTRSPQRGCVLALA